jgi:hypothetical protein
MSVSFSFEFDGAAKQTAPAIDVVPPDFMGESRRPGIAGNGAGQ